jgi:hypothetical protein
LVSDQHHPFYANTVWKRGNNAALKHIQRISKVVGLAVISGFLEKDPFLGFEGKKDKSTRPAA